MTDETLSPLLISLEVAGLATVITFFVGIGLAYGVLRIRSHIAATIADAVITLPLVLPPTVVGFFLLLFLGKRSAIGSALLAIDLPLVFTWRAAVIAAVIVSLPLMYRTARGAFEALDSSMIHAAQTLGVSNGRIFWRIILPNARHGILAGLV
ncbi:MAG: ABC transporter permease subunit, partial [Selenomonas sp.]|nr:ABC transporter permease subunit [Selenomonas sp.]